MLLGLTAVLFELMVAKILEVNGMITYEEFLERDRFSHIELLAFAHGSLVSNPPQKGLAQLPAPPFLMFDRIVSVERGTRKGRIVAEQDISPDAWYFQAHFTKDPVQPGCLGVDAVWQLLGFYCCLNGAEGSGRALGSKEIEFFGQIRPFDKVVTYDVEVRRFSILKETQQSVVIGNAKVLVDGEEIYRINDAKVGLFHDIQYSDYPNPESANARGGVLKA